jgi:cytochrome c
MNIVKLRAMKSLKVLSISLASLVILGVVSTPGTAAPAQKGDAAKGKEVFDQCSVCHNADSDEKKMGPALKGLFKREKFQNGKKVSEESVRGIINAGGNGMPAYEELLSAEERNDLVAYLKTL